MIGAIAFTRAGNCVGLCWRTSGCLSPHASAPNICPRDTRCTGRGTLLVFVPACVEQRVQQVEIEQGNRTILGTWLKENGKPTDTVYLEPLGYIGYYSGMQMRDFPGLVSPEVVQIRRRLPPMRSRCAPPDIWSFQRSSQTGLSCGSIEYENLAKLGMLEAFQKDYTLAKQFNVADRLRQYEYLPGRKSLEFDATYGVFRRNR